MGSKQSLPNAVPPQSPARVAISPPDLYPSNLDFTSSRGKSLTCTGWVADRGSKTWSTKNVRFSKDIIVPPPAPYQVRVKVYAAGVNPADAQRTTCISDGSGDYGKTPQKQRQRHPPPQWTFPSVCGLEGAGVVESVGWASDDTAAAQPAQQQQQHYNLQVGDRVMFLVDMTDANSGTFCQYVNVDADLVSKLPDAPGPSGRLLDFEEAATLPAAAGTAYVSLFDKLRIERGKSIFISGGSGGVGSVAVQLACYYGLHVIASCSTPNIPYLKSIGAHTVIDYTAKGSIAKQILTLTKGYGVDYILELASATLAEDHAQALRFGGAICIATGLMIPTSDLVFTRQISVHYVFFGALHRTAARGQISSMGSWLTKLYLEGAFDVDVEEVPLEMGATAMDVVAQCHTRGKIALTAFHVSEAEQERKRRGRVVLYRKALANAQKGD